MSKSLVIIGGGNMGRAIIEGTLRAGALPPSTIAVADPDPAGRAVFESRGIACAAHAEELRPHLDPETQVLLAVKPQSLADVARDAAALPMVDRIVISILAGTPSRKVRDALGGRCRVVRVMPNLPAQIGHGCTAVCLGAGATPGDEALAVRLFSGVGQVVERIEEPLMDAFTAVAGSGPAYLFYVAEAMARAAATLGFDPAAAERIVRQTLLGSASLLSSLPERSPAELRAAVTSKGGTTEAACAVFDDAQLMHTFEAALTAARDRGRDLARSI